MRFILFLILLPFTPYLLVIAFYIALLSVIFYLPWVFACGIVDGVRNWRLESGRLDTK